MRRALPDLQYKGRSHARLSVALSEPDESICSFYRSVTRCFARAKLPTSAELSVCGISGIH